MREFKWRNKSVSIHIARILILSMLIIYVNPEVWALAYTEAKGNWEAEYAFCMDDGIPVGTEADERSAVAAAGQSVDFQMTLMAGRRTSAGRFQETFHLYIQEELYEVMTAQGTVFADGWLDSDLTESGYLLEVYEPGTEADSNATPGNATDSSAMVRRATDSNGADGMQTISFRFAEELRNAPEPESVAVEAVTGVLSFALPEDAVLKVKQNGNDCWVTMEKAAFSSFRRAVPIEADLFLQIRENDGMFTDLVEWEPQRYGDRKIITLRVSYQFHETSVEYEPGDLVIEVDQFLPGFSEATRLADRYTQNAHRTEYYVDCDGWQYDDAADPAFLTFTNTEYMGPGMGGYFEVQINANAAPLPGSYSFQAVMKNGGQRLESGPCVFAVLKDVKSELTLHKSGLNAESEALRAASIRFPADYQNYYWVRYEINRGSLTGAVLFAEYKLTDVIPDSCVVLDKNFQPVRLTADQEYVSEGTVRTTSYHTVSWSGDARIQLYVGYPKDRFQEGQVVTNQVTMGGRYEDTGEWVYKDVQCQVKLADFKTGDLGMLYSFRKKARTDTATVGTVSKRTPDTIQDGFTLTDFAYDFDGHAMSRGKPMDIVLGDDLLYITRTDGSTTRLQDHEYRFTEINYPVFRDALGKAYTGYPMTLEVRRAGNDDYEFYSSRKTGSSPVGLTFKRHDDIVAVRFTIEGIQGTADSPVKLDYAFAAFDIFADDVAPGYFYNYAYLMAYEDGKLLNETALRDYDSFAAGREAASVDMDQFGLFIHRSEAKNEVIENGTSVFELSLSQKSTKDSEHKKTDIRWSKSITGSISLDLQEEDTVDRIVLYDIYPDGVRVAGDKMPELDYYSVSGYTTVTLNQEVLILTDGTKLSGRGEISRYMKERTLIDVDNNYRNSGRTMLKLTIDFTDNPVSLKETCDELWMSYRSGNIKWVSGNFYTELYDEDVKTSGAYISNYLYGEVVSAAGQGISYKTWIRDNGSKEALAKDINENGITDDERLLSKDQRVQVFNPSSAVQTATKTVCTEQTGTQFVRGAAKTGPDQAYTYRLRISSGQNVLGNIVMYDTVEGFGGVAGWQGKLRDVDASCAKTMGFAPVIWYSDSETPNSLFTHEQEWTRYKADEITEAQKAAIKTIAIDLRYDEHGQETALPKNSSVYVDVSMKAPSVPVGGAARNRFYTEWIRFNTGGVPEPQLSGLTSNTVQVELREKRIPALKLEISKTDEKSQPITHDHARFGVYYDEAAADPVKKTDGNDLIFETDTADGKAAVTFSPDSAKRRFDGYNTYYMLYLRELKAPSGYYQLGGSPAAPANRYMIKLRVIEADDGTFTIGKTGENPLFSKIEINGDSVSIRAINYRIPARVTLRAQKEFMSKDGTPQNTLPQFHFKAALKAGNSSAVMIPREIVENEAAGPQADIVFADIAVAEAGVYTFDITEISGQDPGIKYDSLSRIRAVVKVKPDASGVLVQDGDVVYTKEGPEVTDPLAAVFYNYERPEARARLQVHKTLLDKDLEEKMFRFEAKLVKGQSIVSQDRVVYQGNRLTDAYNSESGTVVFEQIRFPAAGDYVFALRESTAKQKTYIEYDDSTYYAWFRVVQNPATKGLELERFDYYEESSIDPDTLLPVKGAAPLGNYPHFINAYRPKAEVSFDLEKRLIKANGQEHTSSFPEYKFRIRLNEALTNSSLHPAVSIAGGSEIAVNTILGSRKTITFEGITLTAVGTYVFDVTEEPPGGGGLTQPDTGIIRVTVRVADNLGTGEYSHTISFEKYDNEGNEIRSPEGSEKQFINRILPLEQALTARKELDGREISDGEFEFAVSLFYKPYGTGKDTIVYRNDNGERVSLLDHEMRTVNQGSAIEFPKLIINEAGWYEFEIREINHGRNGMTYDDNVYYAILKVREDYVTRELTAEVTYCREDPDYGGTGEACENNLITFINDYEAQPTQVSLDLKKQLLNVRGKPVTSDLPGYEFHIAESAANPIGATLTKLTAENSPDGSILFESIQFERAGTFDFLIHEVKGDDLGIEYDENEITATVRVIDEDAVLKVDKVTYSKADRTFVNKIKPAEIRLQAQKSLNGRVLRDGEFHFIAQPLDVPDGTGVTELTARNDAAGDIIFPSCAVDQEGVYVFRLTEAAGTDPDIQYDSAVYYAQVTAERDQNRIMKLSYLYGSSYDEAAKMVGDILPTSGGPVFENRAAAYVTIKKTVWRTDEPLSGAVFQLSCRRSGTDEAWTVVERAMQTAGADGSVRVRVTGDFWQQEYCLTEIKPPFGYSNSRVGIILFGISREGLITGLSHSGWPGYVELLTDQTGILVKNQVVGERGGGERPTLPAEPVIPTVPVPDRTRTVEKSARPGGNRLTVIDDMGVPYDYAEGERSELARTGDFAVPLSFWLAIMSGSVMGIAVVVHKRRRDKGDKGTD